VKGENKYYLVDADALPDVFIKVTKAKELLETGAVKTVAEAVDKVDLSRSAFYKYRDMIRPFRDLSRNTIVSFSTVLHDRPGVLAAMLSVLTGSGANILTINQSIPTDGAAIVTFSLATAQMKIATDELITKLRETDGVITVEVQAG